MAVTAHFFKAPQGDGLFYSCFSSSAMILWPSQRPRRAGGLGNIIMVFGNAAWLYYSFVWTVDGIMKKQLLR